MKKQLMIMTFQGKGAIMHKPPCKYNCVVASSFLNTIKFVQPMARS